VRHWRSRRSSINPLAPSHAEVVSACHEPSAFGILGHRVDDDTVDRHVLLVARHLSRHRHVVRVLGRNIASNPDLVEMLQYENSEGSDSLVCC